ncbi:transcription-repair coupling factor [Desulfohalovibrio reitneri]|uniref:transcription-repair coupling factor n=1 Tax=Desulfohalovibrio reitneri TaxID=1307759 RepID=UPI00055254D4|nr:transcription-repair coupling factor [Desulfohalovibrio reitneri]
MNFPRQLHDFLRGRGDSLRVFKSGVASQALLAQDLMRRGQSVVWVLPDEKQARRAWAMLHLFASSEATRPGFGWHFLPGYPASEPNPREWVARWAALSALTSRRRNVGAVLSVDNLLPKWPSPELLSDAELLLRKGEEMLSDMLLEQLASWGYRRTSMVGAPGEMAMRGDVLDVFAPGAEYPVRMEFFGDALDELRLFDPRTQRSVSDLREVLLLPAAPALLTPVLREQALERLRHFKTTGQIKDASLSHFTARIEEGDGTIWPGLYYDKPAHLEEFLPHDAVYLLSGGTQLREKRQEARWAWQGFLENLERDKGWTAPEQALIWPEESRGPWSGKRHLVFEEMVIGLDREGVELPEREVEAFSDLYWKPEERDRPWAALMGDLRSRRDKGLTTVLSFHTSRSRSRFLKLAEQEDIRPHTEWSPEGKGVFALVSSLKKGMELEWWGARVLAEDVLQPKEASKPRPRRKDFKGLATFEEIESGDLLVHRDFGVCRFGGLTRLQTSQAGGDYLLLHFDGQDKLYLPVDRMRVVQRFKGPEGSTPSLDSLRGARWKAAKERARKAVEKIAHELVEMYAYRRVAKGYSYDPPGELYWEFEAGFGFEETPDQAQAIQDVLADLENPEPMDRLVCGDVGFGKTEVALRAAFRAVCDGKQVVLLCPTTVLAEQHYQTFKRRTASFPVTVAMLSRFVPKAEQKNVISAAARGKADILIGTHRVLSKDVEVPNLGLLILDEEQRFGVKHKERIKELKRNIDCLTLTATPIPRTLQLSLSGIRSLSVIETPPVDRKPVETALIEREEGMLRTILLRELERGGQVFWVHNRVRGLDSVENYVKRLVPEARVGMAHGQMAPTKLEETMHSFWHGELDVLVCTAIVESGLDFPNANTLIVDQAHMFGLGQLYQLRGRVGRSERQAYAYFVVPNVEAVNETARRRLRVILDMDYLGAGFKVAMEDLRLRGAGNILGEAQSGQIAKVGLDLFLEMLDEEVRRLRGEGGPSEAPEPEINFVFEASLPEDYIDDPRERLRYYKAFSSARDDQEEADLAMEVKDRFGKMPEAARNFLAMLQVKRELRRLRAVKADLYVNRAVIHWSEDVGGPDPDELVSWLQSRQGWAKLLPPGRLEVRMEHDEASENMAFLRTELASLAAGQGKEGE